MIQKEFNYSKLFKAQEKLDELIQRKHMVDRDGLADVKVLDLIDELAEVMNKVGAHKYWKTSKYPKSEILEEYADGWHFILSIGNDLDMPWSHHGREESQNLVSHFRKLFLTVNSIYTPIGWTLFVNLYKGLGGMLGFTPEEVEKAYHEKYEENIKRQERGY